MGEQRRGRFDPQRSAVYRLARRHTRAARALLEASDTTGLSGIVAQLKTSTGSITANIREGFGEWRKGKRANYFMIAMASVGEAASSP